MNIAEKARWFAIGAHRGIGQKRKYTGEPYDVHLQEVAMLTRTFGGTPEMIAAAWLHDVIEDTKVSLEDVAVSFGAEIGAMVWGLTKFSDLSDGNREKRSQLDRDYLSFQSKEVQTIKIADLISNSSTIVKHDPKFAVVYLKEKRQLLEVLTKPDESVIGAGWYSLSLAEEKLKEV